MSYLFPVIPIWLQVLACLGLFGIGLFIAAFQYGHFRAVNSVQFNPQGTEVVSGSDDQSFIRWAIQGKTLHIKDRKFLGKSLRVVRFRPPNSDQIAIGFENGQVNKFDLVTHKSDFEPETNNADRVFDIVFSQERQLLYSAHGSGKIQPWEIGTTPSSELYDAKTSIQALSWIGEGERYLAIGGRYLDLLVLDTQRKNNAFFPLGKLPKGVENEWITSLSSAKENLTWFASSNNQGEIRIWNTRNCLPKLGNCTSASTWKDAGPKLDPIRAIALSSDACFLTSVTESGKVKLWSLDQEKRLKGDGRQVAKYNTALKAVDIMQNDAGVWIVTGGADAKVRLHHLEFEKQELNNQGCRKLKGG